MKNVSTDKKEFWRSLKEYYDNPETFRNKINEFQDGVTDDFNPDELNKFSRRKFLALMTASAALTATACTNYRDKGEIIPFTNRAEGHLPGTPDYYASHINGKSVLVKVREGRPINIEGNPDHPVLSGRLDAQTPADLLNLYDPERLKNPSINTSSADWSVIDSEVLGILNKCADDNKEIALITHSVNSPTQFKLLEDFSKKYNSLKIYSYELVQNNRLKAWKNCYGNLDIPSISWDKAKIILALEADFLARDDNAIGNAILFAQNRDVMNSTEFNRLYAVEGGLSLTGMNADYRLPIRPDAQFHFVTALLNHFVIERKISFAKIPAAVENIISNYSLADFSNEFNVELKIIKNLANDLLTHQGSSIIYAGETLPVEVHTLVFLLNEVLANTKLYNFKSGFKYYNTATDFTDFKTLSEKLRKGEVGAVINFDANPVYHLPSAVDFADAFSKFANSISIVESENETSAISKYVLAANHELESWGDHQTRADLYELQQPVIAPLFDTRQKENILLTWLNGVYDEKAYHKYLMANFSEIIYKKQNTPVDVKTYWYNCLHDGFVELKNSYTSDGSFNLDNVSLSLPKIDKSNFVVHLQKSYFVGDGKFTNNGWLQEIPHPVTKITWDNYASISPLTADSLGVKNDDLIEIKTGEGNLTIAAFVQPGLPENTIVIELGYGRSVIGDVGKGTGFNANKLISIEPSNYIINKNVSVSKIGGRYKLVSTQEHHSLDDTFVKDFHKLRKIIREGSLEEYKNNPNFLHEDELHLVGITREHQYEGLKWGMAIDLNKCISCASCVTACNIENNVPVVGKDQVSRGREMQWMRIDRYYSGTPNAPEISNQPMLCQHCDNAPCENVCPVNATNHSADGLNQMAYNRCVGTRYCANNCPYKVRRFNFYDFREHLADAYYQNNLSNLIHNPEVTVRSRGVMEKCTFCIQRIMDARSEAIKENRELKGTDVVTACQSVCPTNAIVFGDINDKNSKVSKYREHKLGYHVLEELYVKPNVTYLAKLRNTHSEES